jgi:hypothetical protein
VVVTEYSDGVFDLLFVGWYVCLPASVVGQIILFRYELFFLSVVED